MFFGIPPGHGVIYGIILYSTGAIIIAMFVRAVASWFRMDERFLANVRRNKRKLKTYES